jgi:DNA-binding HxlR family transcriptional regulator
MPGTNYEQVISEAKELCLSDQLRLLEDIAILIRQQTTKERPRSILELQGKGKHIWEKINVKTYIEKERSSWDG